MCSFDMDKVFPFHISSREITSNGITDRPFILFKCTLAREKISLSDGEAAPVNSNVMMS